MYIKSKLADQNQHTNNEYRHMYVLSDHRRNAFKYRIFSVCAPPRLVGTYYLHPPDARAICLHNDLPCNDNTCMCNWGA